VVLTEIAMFSFYKASSDELLNFVKDWKEVR
jgi:hypothetical protein